MPVLMILVDFDNVEPRHRAAGPVALAKVLVSSIPGDVLATYTGVTVRLYGGWRSQANLTTGAQRLIPDIRANSPTVTSLTHAGELHNLRLTIELADKPIDTQIPFEETFVKNRTLRKFRALPAPWSECSNHGACGFSHFTTLSEASVCGGAGCVTKLGDILVRDEQKMVDTLIVADIAHQVFVAKTNEIVVVSSDTDMWPGVLLALRAGCMVIHVHTKAGWRTQRHLMNTLTGQMLRIYKQLSI